MTSIGRIGPQGIADCPDFGQRVVDAARAWADALWSANEREPFEFSGELPVTRICTEEERMRRDLLDAVHDLDHHCPPPRRAPGPPSSSA